MRPDRQAVGKRGSPTLQAPTALGVAAVVTGTGVGVGVGAVVGVGSLVPCVEEHNIHTGDVERHPGCQHDACLGDQNRLLFLKQPLLLLLLPVHLSLPEVVHHGQHHEDSIIDSACCQGGYPHCQVLPANNGHLTSQLTSLPRPFSVTAFSIVSDFSTMTIFSTLAIF